MHKIIVTGCGGSAGWNYIKSLKKSPEKIYVVGTDSSKHYAHLSIADKTFLVPPYNSPDYIDEINSIVEYERIDLIHAQPDPEVLVLAKNRDRLKAKLFMPTLETIQRCQDKMVCNAMLAKAGVPTPQAWLADTTTLKTAFRNHLKLWLRAKEGAGSLAALPVINKKQAEMWMDYWETRGISRDKFMLSEFLPGREYAFQSIWKDGELITSATRQRLEYLFQNRMPSGQSSTPTIAKTFHNETVNKVASQAVRTIDNNATGVFCVDLKENDKGIPCVTEINAGRFFTTSLFITLAGSNMPYLALKLGFGERIPAQLRYDAVKENIYWIRQIDCGFAMVKGDEYVEREKSSHYR